MAYLLSIVVPTKNRYPYLKHLIQLVKSFDSNDIELVVQDNTSDNQEIVEFCQGIDYQHLKYYHIEDSISVGQNSDNAILNSTGEYVCLIGDDDGVTPGIVGQVKELKKLGYEAMITRIATYNWPDYVDNSCFHLSGAMVVDKSKGANHRVDVKKELNKVCKKGFSNISGLPKVYQAVVKRSVLDKVYNKCGTFFPGPSPDMANAIALTCFIDRLWYNNTPSIITGQCRSVGGGERIMEKLLPLTEIPHLPKDILSYWDEKLPNLWCSDTIWPGSASIAAKIMGINLNIDYNLIYARFVFSHPAYRHAIDDFNYNIFLLHWYKLRLFCQKAIKWMLNRLTYIISGKKTIMNQSVYRNIIAIENASKVLNSCI